MKNLTLIAITILLAACGAGTAEKQGELDLLKAKKDSLRGIYDDLAKQIAEIDSKIAELDTSNNNIPLVTTLKVTTKPFAHYFEVQGAIEADQNAQVFAETPGEIVAINVKEGQQVSKGDIIMQLDAKVLRSSLAELETAYELVKDAYERQERLWNQKIGSEMQYLKAKNDKESMEKKITSIKAQLDMYNIRAPFSGIVDEIIPKVGEAASPGFPVARIVNLDKVYIKSDVSENYLGVVKSGTKATVNFPSIGKQIETKVTRVGNFINPNNRTFKARIDLENTGGELKPNQLADISYMDFQADSTIVIPTRIIQQDRQNNEYVYVLKDTSVEKVMIKSGLTYRGEAMITEGLKPGMILLDKGARSVQHGDVVEVVKE
eukprot:gnl/MRDRNA2_/MRDRNA2_34071_c0_seq1.p3 gnl/MRDRNA2_/MRDRNA2_34071_c0~~gnl/MRDRNA2_/MRDRNA2_34071_c0_seq1.p3  ORF type:complete len:377 (+),score=37.04 gnl/MRDRNA2_/MRDRNA2_34071_c0_seq1:1989-3119(+)